MAKRSTCGRDDAAEAQQQRHAHGLGGLDLAARHGPEGAAEDLGLIGAGDHADRQRAGREGREADKALVAEEVADARRRPTSRRSRTGR